MNAKVGFFSDNKPMASPQSGSLLPGIFLQPILGLGHRSKGPDKESAIETGGLITLAILPS